MLKVEILAVETDSFGSTAVFPGFGLLGDLFEEPYLVTWGLHDGIATSGRLEGVRIPADPFIGVIGVAPSHERMEQFRAREAALAEAGGDALPPEASGAVPAVGALRVDGPAHDPAARDGRQPRRRRRRARVRRSSCRWTSRARCSRSATCTSRRATARSAAPRSRRTAGSRCASTCSRRPSSASARRRRRSSRSSRHWKGGRRHFVTTGLPIRPDGSNADMDTTLAARNALLAMIDWLGAERGLTREQAYVLCSVAVDLRISEIVDMPNPVVSALCPLDIFHSIPPRRGA